MYYQGRLCLHPFPHILPKTHPNHRQMAFFSQIFGAINVETPPFDVIQRRDEYEIREYRAHLRATTACGDSLNAPFGRVAKYIFGSNAKQPQQRQTGAVDAADATQIGNNQVIAMTAPVVTSEKMSMTAPVIVSEQSQKDEQENKQKNQQSGEMGRTLSFIMPAQYATLSDLPRPLSPDVRLEEIPPRKVAVIQFSWMASKANVAIQEAKLRAACERDGTPLGSQVELFQYNPPWTLPFLRTNEIAIDVVV